MSMRAGSWVLFCFTAILTFAFLGCKPSAPSGEQAFANASPELKAAWQKASDAAKANDYAGALVLLQDLKNRQGLTPEQQQAVDKTATAVSDKMYEAAGNGDPKAKQALDDMRKVRGR